ncbi:MAG: PhzF family phenazine biosynthesis protein [Candidatus Cloacimonetes bacterium]|nr:PhzF family phenazine biosynthesis protein [Candidatus Cloacimonadota bacterium]
MFFADERMLEDAVTGSAHCSIGSYWKQILGKTTFVAEQLSRRSGILFIQIANKRVYMNGFRKTILRGELTV